MNQLTAVVGRMMLSSSTAATRESSCSPFAPRCSATTATAEPGGTVVTPLRTSRTNWPNHASRRFRARRARKWRGPAVAKPSTRACRSRARAGTSASVTGTPAQRVTAPAITRADSSNSTIRGRRGHSRAASSQAAVTLCANEAIPSSRMSSATNIAFRTRWAAPSRVCTAPVPKRVACTGSGMACERWTWSSS